MKCCISIDDDCAKVAEDGLIKYCLNQDTCEDFDYIWTDEDALQEIIDDMKAKGREFDEEINYDED